ncbi:glycosyltransferase [Paenibacillus mesophilus]|uniref:CPCC family cysteine-rich protein n=1 Tax=Paenibacillus mesophilus TaxID=2582849 RepID=UPI00110D8A6A|nr:CPCC family cysteine-rich protein [Paenibacillus mesophilus]TMV43347.1 glycosyltransferase [Paenibacillus mesophilus]
MVRVQCPCCDYFTFDSIEDALFEICEVCFWQYDEVAHDRPKVNIGANHISLDHARENYKKYGACEERFKAMVRMPLNEELPINNLK